jgi:hypothetical protein
MREKLGTREAAMDFCPGIQEIAALTVDFTQVCGSNDESVMAWPILLPPRPVLPPTTHTPVEGPIFGRGQPGPQLRPGFLREAGSFFFVRFRPAAIGRRFPGSGIVPFPGSSLIVLETASPS